MVQFLKVSVNGNKKNFAINNSWTELFNFQNSFNCQNFGPARDMFYIGLMYCVLRTNLAKFAKETSTYFRNIQH